MSVPLACPLSATEVHWSTFSALATATGTLNILRLPNNHNRELQRPQCCNFHSNFRIGSCQDVKKVELECASNPAL